MAKNKKNTVETVTELVTPIIKENGLILWDVLFEKEGADWYLKVLIDKEDGITFTDCENVSRPLDKLLDEVDPIEQSYFLEVSSAGIDRALKKESHFLSSLGQMVTVKSIRPIDNEREFIGELLSFKDDVFNIKILEKEMQFNLNECSYVKIYFDYFESNK